MAKVLVTGANGFVGKRLVLNLLKEGHEVYALCRIKGTKLFSTEEANLHYLWGDIRNPETLNNLPKDIQAAYYLIHSMSEIAENLIEMELSVAEEFIKAIKKTEVQQIIYLGGIINDESHLSPHLKSRLLVEDTLKQSGIPVTILRASIIIGCGSASFEIIRDLCEKLPVMIAPKWVKSVCQPIAIVDVLFYLTKVLLNSACYSKTLDIGGPDALSFKELMLRYSKFRNLKRYIIDIPVLTPRLSSYWLVLITSVRFSLCYYLVESMKSNSIVVNDEIKKIIFHECLDYEQALDQAFQKVEQSDLISTWMDSWEVCDHDPNIQDYIKVPAEGCLKDQRIYPIQDSKEAAIKRIWCIGGDKGYYGYNWAWYLRGLFDKLLGGVGLNRGRKHPTEISVGDSIDFWRVLLADPEKGHLILYAAAKMPGEAWLEFKINDSENKPTLVQTATFRPQGLQGRLYWWILSPFHYFIFRKMAKSISGQ